MTLNQKRSENIITTFVEFFCLKCNISSLRMKNFRSCGQIEPNQPVILSIRDSSNKIVICLNKDVIFIQSKDSEDS